MMASLTIRPYFFCSFQVILIFLLTRFLRNPSELKSIKNISLLRQQMEAQAAAQKLAAQRIANLSQVESTQGPPPEFTQTPGPPTPVAQATKREASSPIPHPSSSDDLPTDLSMDADEKTRLRERLEREQSHYHHARQQLQPPQPRQLGPRWQLSPGRPPSFRLSLRRKTAGRTTTGKGRSTSRDRPSTSVS